MRGTVTSKGQITIPVQIRRRLALVAGTVLEFDDRAPMLVATKSVDRKRMRSVIGCARRALAGTTSIDWLEQTRGPRQRRVR